MNCECVSLEGPLIARGKRASSVEPGGTLRLDIIADVRKHSMILADIAQVGQGDVGNKGEHPGKWRVRIAN